MHGNLVINNIVQFSFMKLTRKTERRIWAFGISVVSVAHEIVENEILGALIAMEIQNDN